jgi:transcriptional regulator of NAD metabolism
MVYRMKSMGVAEMTSEQRRDRIILAIAESSTPLTGANLAKLYNVTRQVIVQDVAILRAAGYDIIATPQGYIMPRSSQPQRISRVMAVKHSHSEIEDELNTIVDLGGRVLDVIIEHPVYGEFKGRLMMSSRSDVKAYLEMMAREEAEPLSALTEGVHLHTIEADSIPVLDRIENALREKGYLLK